jgi:hypothetical protein
MNYGLFKQLCDGCDSDHKITLTVEELRTIIEESKEQEKEINLIKTRDPRLLNVDAYRCAHYDIICSRRHKYLTARLSEDEIIKLKDTTMYKYLTENLDTSTKSLNILRQYERFFVNMEGYYPGLDYDNLMSQLKKVGRTVWEVINDPAYIWPDRCKIYGLGKMAIEDLGNLRLTEFENSNRVYLKDLPGE